MALVGANGAGKTTLAKLIARLYTPDSGTISWNGKDIGLYSPLVYRRSIAALFQDFNRYEVSARENVGFGDTRLLNDSARIVEASRQAEADDFLCRLPSGYETILGKLFDGGHELSVGQWQRVAIARAFLREAPLVIMDEPTASLDARAEVHLVETVKALSGNHAVLLISHRFSTVQVADRICVLEDGRVAEEGSHAELMALRGIYAELCAMQAAGNAGEAHRYDSAPRRDFRSS